MSDRNIPTNEQQYQMLLQLVNEGNLGFLVKSQTGRGINYLTIVEQHLRSDLGAFFIIEGKPINGKPQQEIIQVPLSSIFMPGKPGKMMSIYIIHPKMGRIIVKYVGFHNETRNYETGETVYEFEVLIRGDETTRLIVRLEQIQPNFPSQQEGLYQDAIYASILKMREFMYEMARIEFKKQEAALNAEKLQAAKDFELREQTAQEQSRFPLILPRPENNPVVYPFFGEIDQMVLFFLLKKLEVAFKSSYEFNLLVIRFLACGSQERFLEKLPGLSDEDEFLFRKFVKNYNQFFMGHPMTSRMQRSSNLTVKEVFKAQFKIAKALEISSQCALNIPRKYFTDPEPEVEVRKGPHDLIAHSSLEKLE